MRFTVQFVSTSKHETEITKENNNISTYVLQVIISGIGRRQLPFFDAVCDVMDNTKQFFVVGGGLLCWVLTACRIVGCDRHYGLQCCFQ